MESSQVTAQRHEYSFLNCWIVLSFAFFIVWLAFKLLHPNLQVLGVSVIINLILMLSILGRYRVKRITINVSESMLYILRDKWFFVENELQIPLQNVSIREDQINRVLSIKVNRFTVFANAQRIAEVMVGISGWNEEQLKNIKRIIQEYNR